MRTVNSLTLLRLVTVMLCISAIIASAQTNSPGSIEDKVERLLQKHDLTDLANELAQSTATKTTESLLIKLSVFARAGHRSRVLETLTSIPQATDYKESPYDIYIFHVARKAAGLDDLAARKAFYELIAVSGDENITSFVPLWEKQGDLNAIEKWLKPRAATNESWWLKWLAFRKRQGTVQEIFDELSAAIRKDPADFDLVRKYLNAVTTFVPTSVPSTSVSYGQDVTWLTDTAKTDLAYNAYELAVLVKGQSPATAIKLLEKSLSLPYTEKDRELFGQRAFRGASVSPTPVNAEKQLRYWTKRSLVELYQQSRQPHLAQPLAEQLVGIDMNDIQAGSSYQLAGGVQASSGHRVIEAKILKDEAANINSAQYWIDRANYYRGRGDDDQTWQTLMTALEKFPYAPHDYSAKSNHSLASSPRLLVLLHLRMFRSGDDEREKAAEEILRDELRKAVSAKDTRFLFELTRWMENDFEDLFDEFYINTDMLPFVLNGFDAWGDELKGLIVEVMENDKWDLKKRQVLWNQLSAMATQSFRDRTFSLAKAMTGQSEYRMAIPLLENCLKFTPVEYEKLPFNRESVERELFDAYIETGDWQKAEEMVLAGFRYWGNEIGSTAVAAAKSGDIKNSVRLWKMNANYDRRNIDEVVELAKTGAKPLLREFYTQMKRRDPLTDIPDKALGLLN